MFERERDREKDEKRRLMNVENSRVFLNYFYARSSLA